ncbi:DUF922 domain-containing protein [Sphingomonas alba]|uniref:DUF922 domain-containing Zn-dependent protease n=1 Tax=Sphingomonas alba TaxID=2908208 RepID=A0ABT0RL89_9SPHN|nr:DUF922 domain-containing protein [Sphingomonas alba]MCL6683338.1 DUF922 domain-containing Zn-dependent protease [Sphingomonas alba]
MMMMLIAAMAVQAATPPAGPPTAARPLKDIPGVTVSYYDVAGKNQKQIKDALKKLRPVGANGEPQAIKSSWDVGAGVQKQTEGDKCTIIGAKVTLEGKVELPRLADPAKADADTVKAWNEYVARLENVAALDFNFVSDRMPDIEKALTGQTCDAASGAMSAAVDRLAAQERGYMASLAPPAAAPQK